MHRALVAAIVLSLGEGMTAPPLMAWQSQKAAATFACNRPGGEKVVMDMCGARWTASNLRAHALAGNVRGSDVATFFGLAERLETLAAERFSHGRFEGQLPAAASADDGVLAAACPGQVWSYANAGNPPCQYGLQTRAHLEAARAAARNAPASTPAPVSSASGGLGYEETAQWLADNVPGLANGSFANGATSRTTAFSITDCVVTWQFETTRSDSTTTYQYSVPFNRVTDVGDDSNDSSIGSPSTNAIKIVAKGTMHQLAPDVKDFDWLQIAVSSPDAGVHLIHAFSRLATLCRAKGDPFG